MGNYEGINIPEEVIIVENKDNQGYVVTPGNQKMLDSAISWAEGWYWGTNEKDPYKQYKYKNGTFQLSLSQSAGHSSQGGKLSFWNCLIKAEDGKEFLIGISSDILLKYLLNETLINGKAQNKCYLGRQKGNIVGVYNESMEDFKQSIKDEEKRSINSTPESLKEK